MFKRHHKLFLILAVVGVLWLLYEWFKNRKASASSAAALDTSNYPTVITAGGGGMSLPSQPSFGVASFDQPQAVSQPGPSSMTVMPGTSASGVPAHTDQAQEFNLNQPIATPSTPGASNPSYYLNSQELANPGAVALPYQKLDPTYLQGTSQGVSGTTTLSDLKTYLGVNLNAFEITADLGIGNNKTAGVDYQTVDQVKANLTSEGANYIAQHPEVSTSDNAGLIQSLVDSYQNFIGTAGAKYTQETNNAAPVTSGPAQTGTPTFQAPDALHPLGSWTLAQSTSTPNTSTTTAQPASTYKSFIHTTLESHA